MPLPFPRYLSLPIYGLTLLVSPLGHAQQPATNTPPSTPPAKSAPATPVDAAAQLITAAIERVNANDTDGALSKLTDAIKLNPKSSAAYVLRGSLYAQKKQWPQAEQDFKAAQQLAPTNIVLKFNLVEIKFMQKQYDAARPGFLALESDPDMGDLASYKVFLCDLFGGHEAVASKELDAFNKIGSNPSYYFSNAAWDLYHKKTEEGWGWLNSAANIFAPRKNAYYASSLKDLGYLSPPPSSENK